MKTYLKQEIGNQINIIKELLENNKLYNYIKEDIKNDPCNREFHNLYDIFMRANFHYNHAYSRLMEMDKKINGE
ncbi:MAG TPA: hypothetical protein VNU45_19805 [Rummeliibacillus sp.]|nr:hypothetical protein [Rummeliibacillus sp.]